MSTVAIFGPGLIGGSLALALRRKCPSVGVKLWARSEQSATAARSYLPEVTTDAREATEGASLCVLCTPVGAMPELAKTIAPVLAPEAAVTDAGSTKGRVVADLEAILAGQFVGSHPMAGSEKNGITAARDDLFDGALTILTPTSRTSTSAIEAVEALWKSVGCRLTRMSPEQHDDSVGRISHLPHAAAAALVNAIALRLPEAQQLAGGGYRDSTRIAGGPPAMWSEILLENRSSVISGLDDLTKTIRELKDSLQQGDSQAVERFLEQARSVREKLP